MSLSSTEIEACCPYQTSKTKYGDWHLQSVISSLLVQEIGIILQIVRCSTSFPHSHDPWNFWSFPVLSAPECSWRSPPTNARVRCFWFCNFFGIKFPAFRKCMAPSDSPNPSPLCWLIWRALSGIFWEAESSYKKDKVGDDGDAGFLVQQDHTYYSITTQWVVSSGAFSSTR